MTWNRPAVCFSVDDVHPAPVAAEALGHVRWLQERHPQLRVTLFTTPDWRTVDPYPTRRFLSRVPFVRDRIFTVAVHPHGTYRLDRHDDFCALLRGWQSAEVGLHGLHHVRTGMRPVLEFEGRSRDDCRTILNDAMAIFDDARLPFVRGMSPPGWEAPPPLLAAMVDAGFAFVASARDLDTPVTSDAVANGSGLRGVPLIRPSRIEPGLAHFPTNFQATSTLDRALAILECGGLLSIKAHLLAQSGAYRALDGLTPEYRDSLDRLFSTIEERFGDDVWWTSMGEMAS
jgi:predicted deacetylase